MSIEGKFGNNNKIPIEAPEQPKILEKEGILGAKEVFAVAKKEANHITIKPEDRSSEGKLLVVPGGLESNLSEEYWKLVRTESFKKWFGDSDIRDENGEPALVYHTTGASLDGFDAFLDEEADKIREQKNKRHGDLLVESGFYFTSGNYDYGNNRISVFINAKVKEIKKHGDIMNLKQKELIKYKREGYSGLVHLFDDSENEIRDKMKISIKEHRREVSPRSVTDKLFFGFNKIKELVYQKDYGMEPRHPLGRLRNSMIDRKELREIRKEAKSPFFEVCVFNADQIMIVEKEDNYKDKI
jgi:hypothetical protein